MKQIFCCLLAILCLSGCASSLQEKTESVSNQTAPVSSQQQVKQDEQEMVQPEKNLPLEGKVICVDPGHEVTNLREQEPINPYSSETKEAFVGGTTGKNQTEEQLNLSVGLKLQALLEKEGATVVLPCDWLRFRRLCNHIQAGQFYALYGCDRLAALYRVWQQRLRQR